MNSTRKLYLDNIRWMTVAIVVIYHVIYIFNGVQPFGVIGPFQEFQIQDGFQYLVYPWFMALLFVVSGASARYYLEHHTTKEFVRDKTRKLLVPSTLGLFVFHWTTGYYNMAISHAFDTMPDIPSPIKWLIMSVSGIGPLWYIQVLWILSMLLLPVRKIEKDRLYRLGAKTPVWLLVLFTGLAYGFAQILNTPMITVYRFGIYGFCFFVGYFCFSHEEVVQRLSSYWWILGIVAVGLGIAYVGIYFGTNYAQAPVLNNLLACVYCWIAILAIFATMKKYGNFSNGFTRWMCKESWGMYIFHYLPLAACAYYLTNLIPNMPPILVYLLVGISAFAGSVLLNEVIGRIPVVRYCVLGIKKEK